eukprot:TRINITY_DN23796_c0_g1_i1.p1 TRINITY_DN23796_c0_g1~~TRINITY_DN23796_c0_g1_i1.p1  ORF type:complete len:338 (-),score=24.83 TRINITY_DN23796_c0_g1_i1:138-1151(-)
MVSYDPEMKVRPRHGHYDKHGHHDMQPSGLSWKHLLFLVLLLLCIVYSVLAVLDGLDHCFRDRFIEKDNAGTWWESAALSAALFGLTEVLLVLLFFQLVFWQEEQPVDSKRNSLHDFLDRVLRVNWSSLFAVSYTVLWYGCTYSMCYALKHFLADTRCHTTPNSVSGHASFHIFYALCSVYLVVRLKRNPRQLRNFVSPAFLRKMWFGGSTRPVRLSTKLLLLTYVMFVVCAAITLSRTWTFGYHTQRQMLYGGMLAIISHFLWLYVLEFAAGHSHSGSFLLGVLLATVAASSAFVYQLTNSIPFDSTEFGIFGVLFVVMVFTLRYHLKWIVKHPLL